MRNLLLVVVILLVAISLANELNWQKSYSAPLQGDEYVSYKIEISATSKIRDDIYAKIREFIWRHWQSQECGTVRLQTYSKEGLGSFTTYRLGFSSTGKFEVTVSIEREGDNKHPAEAERIIYSASAVDRVKMPKNGLTPEKQLSPSENLDAKKYLVRLKGDAGKVLVKL